MQSTHVIAFVLWNCDGFLVEIPKKGNIARYYIYWAKMSMDF